MPPDTIYVGRGSRWGNPFPTHEPVRDGHGDVTRHKIEIRSPQEAVKLFAKHILPYSHHGIYSTMEYLYISEANLNEMQSDLAGKNLACWCDLDKPCHADWLLEMANKPQPLTKG